MKSLDTLQAQLLDIEFPPPPAEAADNTLLIAGLMMVAIIALFIIKTVRSHTFQQKQALKKLQQELNEEQISTKQASYQLADILKSAHRTKKLFASANQPNEWRAFIEKLSCYRYQNTEGNKHEILALIHEARLWLKGPPR